MKAEQQRMVCSATMEFDYVRLSVRDSHTGEGCAMFLHTDSLGMMMRELRRVVRQIRQARAGHAPTQRAARAPRSRNTGRRRPAGMTPAAGDAAR